MPRLILTYFALATLLLTSCRTEDKPKPTTPVVDTSTAAESDAVQTLSKKIAADSSNAELYYMRSTLQVQDGNLGAASADILKAMELDSLQPSYYITAKDILITANDGQGAINMLQRGLKFQPRDRELRMELVKMYLFKKDYTRALKNIDEVIKIDGSYPDAYFYRGLILKEQNDKLGAIRNFLAAVEFDSDHYNSYMQLGLLFADQGDKLAIDYYSNALRIEPKSVEAAYGKAFFWQVQGQEQKAIEGYRAVMKIDPQYEHSYYNIGYIYFAQDSIDLAQKHFQMAIGVSPAFANAYHMRGMCFEKKGENEKAMKDFKQALVFKEEHALALEGVKRVKKLLGK